MQIKRKGLIVSAGENRVVSASSLPSAIAISGDQRGAEEEEVSECVSVCVFHLNACILCASVRVLLACLCGYMCFLCVCAVFSFVCARVGLCVSVCM